MDDLRSAALRDPPGRQPLVFGDLRAVACLAVGAIISRGWGSSVWSDVHPTFMINITLTTEFVLPSRGAW